MSEIENFHAHVYYDPAATRALWEAWQQGLAAVFCSGALFFLLSLFRIRAFTLGNTANLVGLFGLFSLADTGGGMSEGAQLTAIRPSRPDAIVVPGYYTEVGTIVHQARELGINRIIPAAEGRGQKAVFVTVLSS